MGFGSSIFRRGFNSSKCKTEAKLATARIKLLRNKREVQVRQMRRDIAMLLRSGQDATARIRVEHVIREQNIMEANEIIELFCELVVVRLPIIAKQRDCPADLKEGISSLIYAAARCSDIPELYRISEIFEKKYGKDFVSAARDLRPESGVNRLLIEKFSVKRPTGEIKLKVMKEIAKEYQIEWDAAETELELLKPPEERLDGPRSFVSASTLPVKPAVPSHDVQAKDIHISSRERSNMQFKDMASAAQAAADSADRAVTAAQTAAYLANLHSTHQRQSPISSQSSVSNDPSGNNQFSITQKFFASQSFNISNCRNDEDTDSVEFDDKKILRRNSCAPRRMHSDIKFDESDGLESDGDEIGMDTHSTGSRNNQSSPLHSTGSCCPSNNHSSLLHSVRSSHPPPNRPPPALPHFDHSEGKSASMNKNAVHVHPKLPDYEVLAARFEALKSHRS